MLEGRRRADTARESAKVIDVARGVRGSDSVYRRVEIKTATRREWGGTEGSAGAAGADWLAIQNRFIRLGYGYSVLGFREDVKRLAGGSDWKNCGNPPDRAYCFHQRDEAPDA